MNIDALIQAMTLQEKAVLLQGQTSWTTWDIPRLGIPSIFLSDGPHGLRKQAGAEDNLGVNESLPATCFPTSATMANSWDPELGQALGRALGHEAAANNVHVVLGPGLNIKRSPLCGRNFEYFSEDPYLAGKMAAAYIRGIQEQGVAACPKHFAVNSQELWRMSMDAQLDERTLREIYLTGFEIAVRESNPRTIMTSYNSVNGTYSNENRHLLQDILRENWGFSGFVMTDWGGSNSHTEGVRAGSSLEMPAPGPDSALSLIRDVENGVIEESVLDQRLRELLRVVLETHESVSHAPRIYDRHAHHRLAQHCAAESIVLLENDGILPLQSQAKVVLIGDFATDPRYQGAGSSLVNPHMMTNLRDWLQQEDVNLVSCLQGWKRSATKPDANLTAQALAAAKDAEVVLFCMGLDETSESEGMDRTHLAVPEVQTQLLSALLEVNPNVVLVLSGGAPFLLPENRGRAVIHGYLGGQAGAAAMAQVLTGVVCPSGHLAESWPLALEDTPCFPYYPSPERISEYREGLFVGYRYYETVEKPVRYPFGHGLSYTTFAYSDLVCDGKTVRFTLTNTGDRDGSEVAQIYISCHSKALYRPAKELKGFQKVFLKAGESRQITIALDDKAFRYFNTLTDRFEVETADYDICVGSSVRDIRLQCCVHISGTEAPIPALELPSYRTGHIQQVPDREFAHLLGRPLADGHWGNEVQRTDPICRFENARNPLARFIGRQINRKLESDRKKGDPAPTMLFVYNLPVRAVGQMTGGQITRAMVDDLLYWVNGSFGGIFRFIRDYFRGKKAAKAFFKSIGR